MRFLLNFFLFGILYFAIYYYFPDAFHTMVGWAQSVFDFIKEWVIILISKIKSTSAEHGGPGGEPAKGLLIFALAYLRR
jgi:hypothetical protein